MFKRINNQQGLSLITVLLVFTLFVILGSTLIAFTMNSLTFVNVNKQSITDKVKAENSIEIGLANIDKEIANLNNTYLDAKTALPHLRISLDKVANLGGENGYTLEHKPITTANSNIIIEEVVLKSPIGHSGTVLKKVLAISTIPEVFQYSIASASDIKFNGASYIEGDAFVMGDIWNRNEGKFNRDDELTRVRTSYPALKGNLTVLGNYYYFNNEWVEYTPNSANLNKYFTIVPTIKDRDLSIEKILPKVLIEEKKNSPFPISQSDPDYIWLHDYNFEKTIDHSAKFPRLGILNTGKLVINGDAQINGPLRIDAGGELIVKGDLYVGGNLKIHTAEEWWGNIRPGGKLTVDGSIKVMGEGDLGDTLVGDNNLTKDEISNLDLSQYGSLTLTSENSYVYIDENTKIKNFNFTGKMYIESYAEISGDFNTNGTVYVYRDAVIQDLTNKVGSLVLIADEGIKISNNNQYEDTPKIINAYFYTNEVLEIFGVGSHLIIHGGVHGNPLKLNATKGKTKTRPFKNSFLVEDLYFQGNQEKIAPTKSRLSIIFNKELILNPPIGIPAVDKFGVKVIDTVYE